MQRISTRENICGFARFFAIGTLLTYLVFFSAGQVRGQQVNILGAGATFPQPLYSRWANEFMKASNHRITYQGVGSGAGIAMIKAGAVDFGGSDDPLESQELRQSGLAQFPLIMGAVVPVINLEGVRRERLRLTPELLADIFLGKIKKWNDRRIMAVNQDLSLSNSDIVVVHRADSSGTTWILTKYLSKVSDEWKARIGNHRSVSWNTGVGAKGNQGAAELVKKTPGSIGYVEYAYALRERLNCARLQNRAGKFVAANMDTFRTAANNALWDDSESFCTDLTDQPGDKSWPIMGASYILISKNQPEPEKAIAMLKFFDWSLKSGSDLAIELHYVPIPQSVYKRVVSMWSREILFNSHPLWEKFDSTKKPVD